MNRCILIHGYVEDCTVFDNLLSYLPPYSFIKLNLEEELGRWNSAEPINALTVAQYLVNRYAIEAADLVIGHSMGGWIAVHIKMLTGATAIQVSSFTDQRKIKSSLHNLRVLRWMVFSGLAQSPFALRGLKELYPFDESRSLYNSCIDRLGRVSRTYIYQQFEVLFTNVPPLSVSPDLRIHARLDNIISPPDEPFVEVPGDHFSIFFHPAEVAAPILRLLEKQVSVKS